jgi:hypothetical protein
VMAGKMPFQRGSVMVCVLGKRWLKSVWRGAL